MELTPLLNYEHRRLFKYSNLVIKLRLDYAFKINLTYTSCVLKIPLLRPHVDGFHFLQM